MRLVNRDEIQRLADLFLHGSLAHPVELPGTPLGFRVSKAGDHSYDPAWGMQSRPLLSSTGDDAVEVSGRRGWLRLMVGQWSDQLENEQIVLSSNRKELDERFAQINLNLSLTDERAIYLVKSLSKDGGTGSIKRLFGGASGAEMANERFLRRDQLARELGNEPIQFDGDEWLVVAVLPLRMPPRMKDALFTETLVAILRYAAAVERIRLGALPNEGAIRDATTLSAPRRLSAAERKLVELAAMSLVRADLERQQYRVRDVSSRESYDFEAHKDGSVLLVEVKGTTSKPWIVELTGSEYRVASRERERYLMYVVLFASLDRLDTHELVRVGNPVTGAGCEVTPMRYRVQPR